MSIKLNTGRSTHSLRQWDLVQWQGFLDLSLNKLPTNLQEQNRTLNYFFAKIFITTRIHPKECLKTIMGVFIFLAWISGFPCFAFSPLLKVKQSVMSHTLKCVNKKFKKKKKRIYPTSHSTHPPGETGGWKVSAWFPHSSKEPAVWSYWGSYTQIKLLTQLLNIQNAKHT